MSLTVLIFGATSDVALSISKLMASDGNDLILAARNVERLENFKKDIEIRFSRSVQLIEYDSMNFESHTTIPEKCNKRPDLVIYVAGYLDDREVTQNNYEEALKTIAVNYSGAITTLDPFANIFEKERSGVIIGISSVAGERGRMSNYYYGSAKAGFTEYLSGLRNRLYHSKVHVATIKPGFIYTKMTEGLKLPAPITAHPDQVAKAVRKAFMKRRNVVYVKWMWKYIMLIIRNIPEGIFKKLRL